MRCEKHNRPMYPSNNGPKCIVCVREKWAGPNAAKEAQMREMNRARMAKARDEKAAAAGRVVVKRRRAAAKERV